MSFDPKKPVQLRNGRPARLYDIEGGSNYPVIIGIKRNDIWYPARRRADGRDIEGEDGPYDLVNVPEDW